MQQEEDIMLVLDSNVQPPKQLSKPDVALSKMEVIQVNLTGSNKTLGNCSFASNNGESTNSP